MDVVLVHHYLDVLIILKKMVHFAILNVEADIKVLVLCVGNIVQIISEMMEHFVLNQNHMVEEEVMHFGIKKNVKENINKGVKSMV